MESLFRRWNDPRSSFVLLEWYMLGLKDAVNYRHGLWE
ncbi:Hypothetical protein Cul131001_0781 [Corynebacterium ulcerans]|nr:Hypothetical protein Cul131001_0781 [Corynebacterium ulcerans]